jgi:DeoR/GlpR family transcriptional regulator of sugar metabolism
MLTEERRPLILQWILKEDNISLQELGKRLKISLMTIRRDLNVLEKQHRIKRVRGGQSRIKMTFLSLKCNPVQGKKITMLKKS